MAAFDFVRTASPNEALQDLAARHARRRTRIDNYALPTGPEAPKHPDPLSISATYFKLRRGLVFLGVGFPIALVIGGGITEIQHSLSAYYHFSTPGSVTSGAGSMRNVFVGVLWAVGIFLLLYRGYSSKEDRALDIAGIAAVMIALFPMDWPEQGGVAQSWHAKIHFASAATFFVMIAYVCAGCAKDTLSILHDEKMCARLTRTYRVLGFCMVAVPVFIVLVHAPHAFFSAPSPNTSKWGYAVLLVEVAGVWVFSAFWFVKSYEIGLIEQE